MTDRIVVSLREISDRFGVGIEGARAKAKRRAAKGTWRILPQNHPADPLRVELPVDEWTRGTKQEVPTSPNTSPPMPPSSQEVRRGESRNVRELVTLLEKLTQSAAATTDRLVQAERERGEAELRAAVAVAGRESAEKSLADARAELEIIRTKLTGEAEKVRTELEIWKTQPWWKRLAG